MIAENWGGRNVGDAGSKNHESGAGGKAGHGGADKEGRAGGEKGSGPRIEDEATPKTKGPTEEGRGPYRFCPHHPSGDIRSNLF
jgi:hypothetical protein